MENTQPEYMKEYELFVSNYKLTEIAPEEVGLLTIKMASYYGKYNLKFRDALRNYSIVLRDFQNQADPTTGKPMSSTKAEVLADATPEAAKYEEYKIDLLNLEQYINGLKSLQRSLMQEFSNS